MSGFRTTNASSVLTAFETFCWGPRKEGSKLVEIERDGGAGPHIVGPEGRPEGSGKIGAGKKTASSGSFQTRLFGSAEKPA